MEQISSSQDKIPGDMSQGSVPGLDSTSQLSCLETMICKMNYMNIWGLVTPSNTLLRRQRISGDSPLLPQAIVIYWSKDESILLLRQYFDPCCCWICLHTLLYADLCCCCCQKKGHPCERYTVPDGQRIYVYTIVYNEVCW